MKTDELKNKILGNGKIILIDVREEDEFKNGFKIPGSVNIPMGRIAADASGGKIPKDKKIVLICRTGNRSGFVTEQLKNLGYDAENLEGGVTAWAE